MKTLLIKFCVIILATISFAKLNAQRDSLKQELKIIGTYIPEIGNVIRWVPSTPGYWRICNYYGYKIERTEFDTTNFSKQKWEIIANNYKPKSLDEWRLKVAETKTDTLLMVAGQAIHGEVQKKEMSLDNMIAKSDELSNLYSACILSAEFSRNAGVYAALRYEDKNVTLGKSYFYRITVLSKDSLQFAEMISSKQMDYPKIKHDQIREGEKAIEILWNKVFYKEYYTAFNVYKSTDKGKSWNKANNIPIANTAYKNSDKFIFRDSLAQNYVTYQYKIEGLTSFATKGPMSDVIEAMGKDKTRPDAPYNIKTKYLGKNMMQITWEVNPNDKDIAGFRISKSNEEEKEFVEITKSLIKPNVRTYIDSTCNDKINNFYWIAVVDKEGNVNVSLPEYGTIIDSIAPAKPIGLKGNIDTNGVVTVTWSKGVEDDLIGYFVHYSNNKKHTFINRVNHPLKDTMWRDTIPLNVLTEEIHYKITAVDHRYNYSVYSDILTVKKPDKVAPTAPIFIDVVANKQGILLTWNNSQSHDVIKNVLIRKQEGENKYKEIITQASSNTKGQFLDDKVEAGKKYSYQLYAIDDAGLKSPIIGSIETKAYEVKTIPPISKPKISKNEKEGKVLLSWIYDNNDKTKFVLYRSLNGGPYVSHKVVYKKEFEDTKMKKGSIAKYKIKVTNENGWQSDFSEELVISL